MIALWAALAMIVQDVTLTLMVQAEARNRWVLAGLLDSVGFLAQVATYGISIDSIVRHGLTGPTLVILGALTVANFVGTGLGVLIGKRYIKEAP